MIDSLIKLRYALLMVLFLLKASAIFAQLPQCDRIYLDQYDASTLSSTLKIYNFNPALPASASNPSVNSIQLPPSAATPGLGCGGLTVSEVLGSSNNTLTFYTVINDTYWYYSPTTLTWVNTNHLTGSFGYGVNIAAGGGYIYNLDGSTGSIYQYNGSSDGTLLVTVSDFANDGPYDLIADCAGNFYLLNATGNFTTPFLRKYSSTGALVQSWTVSNPNAYLPSAGFGIFGTQIFTDNIDMSTFNLSGIVSGVINTNSADLTAMATPLPAYVGYIAGDLGSCASGVPVLPEITITATTPTTVASGTSVSFTSAINAGGSNPQYQWNVNGNPVPGQTGATFTYVPNPNDVVTCLLTSNLACISAPTGLSNAIPIIVDGCNPPTLSYIPKACKGDGHTAPSFTPTGGTFSVNQNGLSINSNTGDINLDASNEGTYIITYTIPANEVCNAASVSDTIVISTAPAITIAIADFGDKLCQNQLVKLSTTPGQGYQYSWFPSTFVTGESNTPNITAKAVAKGNVYVSVTTASGCKATDSIELAPVPCCTVMIPSAFTPNGDGTNDVFKINSIADQTLNQFSIYNRWGERIFWTNKITDGWDGTHRDKPCDMGVYYYYVVYTCANGQETIKKGEVTLIR